MDQSFEELAVVHGSHAGNQAEHSGSGGIGAVQRNEKGWNLNWRTLAGALPIGLAWIGCSAAHVRHAGIAKNLPRCGLLHARRAQGLAAILAVGLNIRVRVIYAMHEGLRSGIANTFVSIEPVSIKSASFGRARIDSDVSWCGGKPLFSSLVS